MRLRFDPSGNVYVTGATVSSSFPVTPGTFDPTYNGFGADTFVTKINTSGSAIIYSTFLGGDGDEEARGIAVNAAGNVFITGYTAINTVAFPTTVGSFDTTYNGDLDAFITKLNPNGSALVYSTFIGGTDSDDAKDIAIDPSGNACITGVTSSGTENFPTTLDAWDEFYNGGRDAFVTKINANGSFLIFSTFLGGDSIDIAFGVSVESSGNVYVTGYTADGTVDFPTTVGAYDRTHNGEFDVFVSKLSSNGMALPCTATLIGGIGVEGGIDIAVSENGNAYVYGNVFEESIDFPTTASRL